MNQSLGTFSLVLLVIPALALRIANRALFGRKQLLSTDGMHVLLSVASTTMFVLAGLGVVIGLIGFWFLLIPLPIVGVVLLLMVLDRTRRAEHRGLIWALAAAANRGVPLPEAARAYADETAGDTGARALTLAVNLERGHPLSLAAKKARLRMGTSMKLAVRLGESLGSLGPAMRQQLTESYQADAALHSVMGRLFYLVAVVLVLASACSFVMLRIVPVFQRMFEEFGLKLPVLTLFVIDMANNGWLLAAVLGVLMTVITVASSGLLVVFIKSLLDYIWPLDSRMSRAVSLLRQAIRGTLALSLFLLLIVFWPPLCLVAPFFLYYAGWFPRNIPVVWRAFKRFDGALVMRGLALAVRRGMPLPAALQLVAESYPLSIVGSRLEAAAQRVMAGAEWCTCLQGTGFIGAADASVLRAAERAGNLTWALEEMADSALRRQALWLMALLQVLFPAALLVIGLFVFIFVCGLFMPLVSLIQALA